MNAEVWGVVIVLLCLIFYQAIRIDHLNRMMRIQQRLLENLAEERDGSARNQDGETAP